jgi:hypothetical protein
MVVASEALSAWSRPRALTACEWPWARISSSMANDQLFEPSSTSIQLGQVATKPVPASFRQPSLRPSACTEN